MPTVTITITYYEQPPEIDAMCNFSRLPEPRHAIDGEGLGVLAARQRVNPGQAQPPPFLIPANCLAVQKAWEPRSGLGVHWHTISLCSIWSADKWATQRWRGNVDWYTIGWEVVHLTAEGSGPGWWERNLNRGTLLGNPPSNPTQPRSDKLNLFTSRPRLINLLLMLKPIVIHFMILNVRFDLSATTSQRRRE